MMHPHIAWAAQSRALMRRRPAALTRQRSSGGGAGESGGADAAAAFRALALARRSARGFVAGREIPRDVLADVLAITQRAPSSFNMQPWTCVVVRSEAGKELLSRAMLSPSNKQRTLDASAVAVFAADLEPAHLLPKLVDMERAAGRHTSAGALDRLSVAAGFYATGGAIASVVKGAVAREAAPAKQANAAVRESRKSRDARQTRPAMRRRPCAPATARFTADPFTPEPARRALSPLQPMPQPVGQAAWAGQATMLAAQTFLFAAEAHGLATAPMEGFDAQRAGVYLKLPRRYRATLVVAAGYAQPDDGARSPRFDPDTVFFEDAFGTPFTHIPRL
mmetsp:Transcript_27393/g.97847  ORF Transcript_27393/g.97847 Transcript_27393/m.97847 type:complete len:336 (-) Transcript_27393:128-1135(-)